MGKKKAAARKVHHPATADAKAQAIKAVEGGASVAEVATEAGVTGPTVYRWLAAHAQDVGARAAHVEVEFVPPSKDPVLRAALAPAPEKRQVSEQEIRAVLAESTARISGLTAENIKLREEIGFLKKAVLYFANGKGG